MPLTKEERELLIVDYAAGVARLETALARVPKEALDWKPAPDKWSAREIVAHCADSETNAYARIRYLVAEENPTIVGYDQDRWARALSYSEFPIDLSLSVIRAVRAATTAMIRRLPEASWARKGQHTESMEYDTSKWLGIYAKHLGQHAAQLERNLEAWRARGLSAAAKV